MCTYTTLLFASVNDLTVKLSLSLLIGHCLPSRYVNPKMKAVTTFSVQIRTPMEESFISWYCWVPSFLVIYSWNGQLQHLFFFFFKSQIHACILKITYIYPDNIAYFGDDSDPVRIDTRRSATTVAGTIGLLKWNAKSNRRFAASSQREIASYFNVHLCTISRLLRPIVIQDH